MNVALKPLNNDFIIDSALDAINNERNSVQSGLISRWPVLNRSVLKYFRFEDIITFGGASGSGKSYITNMLRTDFTDQEDIVIPINRNWSTSLLDHIEKNSEFTIQGDKLIRYALNKECNEKVLFLEFAYDMAPKKETIRTLVTMTGYAYNYILSSKSEKDGKGGYNYNTLSEEEYDFVSSVAKAFKNRRNILTYNTIGTIEQVGLTIREAKKRYPDRKIIVKIDHTLLIKKENESNDFEIQNNIIRKCIDIRDDIGALFILICQTNNEMEDDRRRLTPALHYPTKKDLYAGGQVYQGSDYVFVTSMPSKLGISEYGTFKMPTKDLIHCSMIKSRDDQEGQIWLKNGLNVGRIWSQSYNSDDKTYTVYPNLNDTTKIINKTLF